MYRFAGTSVHRFCCCIVNENRRGTGGLGGEADLVMAAWLGKIGRRARIT
jgi:hypothetical protein